MGSSCKGVADEGHAAGGRAGADSRQDLVPHALFAPLRVFSGLVFTDCLWSPIGGLGFCLSVAWAKADNRD